MMSKLSIVIVVPLFCSLLAVMTLVCSCGGGGGGGNGNPPAGTIYVDGANGDDANNGLSWATAKKTIQAGLDAAGNSGWTVLVANGTYTGTDNKDLDFAGKAIHLNSVGGAANCIIDCEYSGRGFYFHSGETNNAIVEGFTIQNGSIVEGYHGGGVYCKDSSSPTFTNCTISGNSAGSLGGGVCCESYSSPTFTNCTISGNSGAGNGGGGVSCWGSSPTFTNCAISGNMAAGEGGGVDCSGSSPTFTDCTISGNSAVWNGGGGVSCNDNSSPTFTNCTIANNTAGEDGGGVYCDSSSPTFTDCTISGNSATTSDGGGVCCSGGNPTFTNCTISGNSAWDGGCVYCEWGSSPTFTNCTIANNTAGEDGGSVYCENSSSATFRNSIIWGNTATSSGNQIYTYDSSSSVTLSYSCYANSANDVAGGGTVTPDNCINTNPLFKGGGDYHLQGTSPCIDIGNNSYVPAGVTTDLDGNARIYPEGGTVDMGAYEYQPVD